jgi:hypothetical protein
VSEGSALPSDATTTSFGATTTTAPTPTTIAPAGSNGGGGGGGGSSGGGGGGGTHTTTPPTNPPTTTTTLPPAKILDFSVSPGLFVCSQGQGPETASLHYSVTNTAELKISGSGASYGVAVRDAANGTYSVQVACDGGNKTFTLTATAPSGAVATIDTTANEEFFQGG